MGNETSLVFSGIAPHPPIMVPEVGLEAAKDVRRSIDAMAELTKRIIANGAETVILISPHAPLEPDAFVAYEDPRLRGDFAGFRAPGVILEAPLESELLAAIVKRAAADNYDVVGISDQHFDHGTAVPLYFLQRHGWQGRVVALGYCFLSNEDHVRFGSCIRKAISDVGRPVALIASGDLSHRLKPDAPAGYNPAAYLFDDEIVDAVGSHDLDRIVRMDQGLRRLAGECGYRSLLIAIGATQGLPLACEVLNYEAPFGVGYLVAQLTSNKTAARAVREDADVEIAYAEAVSGKGDVSGESLPALARKAVESFVEDGVQVVPPPDSSELMQARAACFVSLKTWDGELRGCIGTIEPATDSLAEEIIANAINAATRDPRFAPVTPEELFNLRYSVDVLSATEPADMEDLDPAIYGVIVEDETGSRRGLLLPALEGIKTVQQQVEIAARKAGIPPDVPVRLSRFSVNRYGER